MKPKLPADILMLQLNKNGGGEVKTETTWPVETSVSKENALMWNKNKKPCHAKPSDQLDKLLDWCSGDRTRKCLPVRLHPCSLLIYQPSTYNRLNRNV